MTTEERMMYLLDEKASNDAQHPLRQAAVEIIESVVEPHMKSKKGLNGEAYYLVEDQIVGILRTKLSAQWEVEQEKPVSPA